MAKRKASQIEEADTAPFSTRFHPFIKQESDLPIDAHCPSLDSRLASPTSRLSSLEGDPNIDRGDSASPASVGGNEVNNTQEMRLASAMDIKAEDSEEEGEPESGETSEESEGSVSAPDEDLAQGPTNATHGCEPSVGETSNQTLEESATNKRRIMTARGKIAQRALAVNPARPREIPRSRREAGAADKMLVDMKEKGRSWHEIRKAWEETTAQKTAQSTLPNRYNRLKDNLTRLKPGDGKRLLNFEAEVAENFRREKWKLVAEAFERHGRTKYKGTFLCKAFGELIADPSQIDAQSDEESDTESVESLASPTTSVPPLSHVSQAERAFISQAVPPSAVNAPSQEYITSLVNNALRILKANIPPGEERPQNVRASDKPSETAIPRVEQPTSRKQSIDHGISIKEATRVCAADSATPGQDKDHRITTAEMRHMVKYRIKNANNRSKDWETIAEECGISTSLRHISRALKKAGF